MKKETINIIEAGSVREVEKNKDFSDITICGFADEATCPNEMIKQYYDKSAIVLIFGDVSVDVRDNTKTYYALDNEPVPGYAKLYVADFGHIIAVATKKKDIVKAWERHAAQGLAVELVVPLKKDFSNNTAGTRYMKETDLRTALKTAKQWGEDKLPRVYRADSTGASIAEHKEAERLARNAVSAMEAMTAWAKGR
jgi:hypothetical protein